MATSADRLKGLKMMGTARLARIAAMVSSEQAGWSKSINTASNWPLEITSSTDSSRPANFGFNPQTSTINPNSAAMISSRATISTLPNAPVRQ